MDIDDIRSITSMSYEQLLLHRKEIDALLQTKKQQAADEIRAKMAAMGFNANDFIASVAKQAKGNGKRYANPDHPEEIYGGKGKRPVWLLNLLNQGRDMEEFL